MPGGQQGTHSQSTILIDDMPVDVSNPEADTVAMDGLAHKEPIAAIHDHTADILPTPPGEDPSFTQVSETAAARHLVPGPSHTSYATPNALATALISLQHAQSLLQNPLRDMSPAPSVAGQDNDTPEAVRVPQPVHAATRSPPAAMITPHAITPSHSQGVTLADPNVVSQHPALSTPDVGSIAATTGTSGPHSLMPMMPSTTSYYAGSRLALFLAKEKRICRPPEVPLLKQVLVQEALRAHEVRIASRPRASAKASTTASPARGVRGPRKSNKLSATGSGSVSMSNAEQDGDASYQDAAQRKSGRQQRSNLKRGRLEHEAQPAAKRAG